MTPAERFARALITKSVLHPLWMTEEFLLLHIEVVIEEALLLSDGKYEKEIRIASWLHDLGRTETEKGHAKKSLALSQQIVEQLPNKQREAVTDAILNHSTKKEPKTAVGRIIRLADKLAKFNERMIRYKVRTSSKAKTLAGLKRAYRKLERIGDKRALKIAKERIDALAQTI